MATFLVDNFLCIIEAAAALHLAVEGRVGGLGRARAFARRLADFLLGDGIADANDHACNIALMRSVRNYAGAVSMLGRRVLAVISANGIPTRKMCANSCVTIDTVLGGKVVSNRKCTTIQFIAT